MSQNMSVDWKEIARAEAQIVRGELQDQEFIRDLVVAVYTDCAANKVGLPWQTKDLGEHSLGMATGAIGPWPVLFRVERILDACSSFWSGKSLLSLYRAMLSYLAFRYDEAFGYLKSIAPENVEIPVWWFTLTNNILFKLGRYEVAISLAQWEILRRKGKGQILQKQENPGEVNLIMERMFRSLDLLPGGFDELQKLDREFYPSQELQFSLADLATKVIEMEWLRHFHSQNLQEILQKAHQYHQDYLLPLASEYYHVYLHLNSDDYETWFLAGCVEKLLNRYEKACQCFEQATKSQDFFGLGHLGLGECAFCQNDFQRAEREFQFAVRDPNQQFLYNMGLLFLGYSREIQGDFRSALNWYETVAGDHFRNIAEIAIEHLETRLV